MKHFYLTICKIFLGKVACKLKKKKKKKPRPTYKFRSKKGPEIKLFYLTKCTIFLGKRSYNPPNHYVYLYI